VPPVSPSRPGGGRPWIERFLGSGDDRTRDAGSFTVRVPEKWSVLDEEEDMILLGADDDSAAVGVLVSGNEDMSLDEIAQAYADKFGAPEPDYDDEDDVFSFTFEDEGVETAAIVAGDEGRSRKSQKWTLNRLCICHTGP
jgi:hypothetical protein